MYHSVFTVQPRNPFHLDQSINQSINHCFMFVHSKVMLHCWSNRHTQSHTHACTHAHTHNSNKNHIYNTFTPSTSSSLKVNQPSQNEQRVLLQRDDQVLLHSNNQYNVLEDAPSVEFVYLVFTCTAGEGYWRWLRSKARQTSGDVTTVTISLALMLQPLRSPYHWCYNPYNLFNIEAATTVTISLAVRLQLLQTP